MGTWFVGSIVLLIVCSAAYKVYKDRKSGKSCSLECGGCTGCYEYDRNYAVKHEDEFEKEYDRYKLN